MRMPDKIKNIIPYDPTEDKYQIKLDANESPFSLPGDIRKTMLSEIEKVFENRYPDPVCRKINALAAKYFGVENGMTAAGNGSDELISIIINSFASRGDRVLIFDPDFSMYAFYSRLAELEIVNAQKDIDFQLTADYIINMAESKNPQMIILSNPCNPTGRGIIKEDMLRVISSLSCLIVIDEAYMDFWDQSVLNEVFRYSNVIVLKTCSKAFGLAGIRLGFAVSNPQIIEKINAARSPFNINSLTQAAAFAVLPNVEYLKWAAGEIIKLKNELFYDLKTAATGRSDIEIRDTHTNFVLLISEKAGKIYDLLLGKSICVRYFKSGFLRITAGSAEQNKAFITAFCEIRKEI